MLIDDNLVSIDSQALSGTVTPVAIALNAFKKPGRQEPIPVAIRATRDVAGGTSLTIGFSQSDTQAGTFNAAGPSWTVTLAELQTGLCVGPRWLPREITKPWIKITVSKTGTFTAGKLFAAVVREDDLPYVSGLYIDKGTAE